MAGAWSFAGLESSKESSHHPLLTSFSSDSRQMELCAITTLLLRLVKDTSMDSVGTFAFQEEEMPDVEIDIDDLLDAANEEERALKLQVILFSNFKCECG